MNYNNIDEIINNCKRVHGDKYDYSLIQQTKKESKSKIICPKHGVFEQNLYNHIFKKYNCPKCSGRNISQDEFIIDSNEIHDHKYDYSLVEYKNKKSSVKIICPIHGIFEQNTYLHLKGHGCPHCAGCAKSNTKEFIKKSNKIHKNKYDYSLVDYKNAKTKVKIICPKHGIFEQTPNKHLRGNGCLLCKESKSEDIIKRELDTRKIKYEKQKIFTNCRFKRPLKFDFFIIDSNSCIEFDGEQHFEKFRFEKNENNLEIRKKRDQIKNIYCKENSIKLFRIKYTDNIVEKLNEILNEIS